MPITQEQLEQVQKESGVECWILSVPLDDEGSEFAEGIVRKPSLPAISAYLTMVDRDPIMAHEALLKNCLVAGHYDARLVTDQDLILGSLAPLQDLIRARRGELKKKGISGGSIQTNQPTSTERQGS
jgi:hypothetical protein